MLASTWRETDYLLHVCCATDDAHTEIYWARKKLCEVLCLKIYRFIQYNLSLEVYNVLFYCYLRPDNRYKINKCHNETNLNNRMLNFKILKD
jgi:hypothetical protein